MFGDDFIKKRTEQILNEIEEEVNNNKYGYCFLIGTKEQIIIGVLIKIIAALEYKLKVLENSIIKK